MEDLLFGMGISVILSMLKNPQKKAAIRKAMLKVFKGIKAAYAGDPEFQ